MEHYVQFTAFFTTFYLALLFWNFAAFVFLDTYQLWKLGGLVLEGDAYSVP